MPAWEISASSRRVQGPGILNGVVAVAQKNGNGRSVQPTGAELRGQPNVDAASCRIAATPGFRSRSDRPPGIGSPLRGLFVGTDVCFHVASGKMPLLHGAHAYVGKIPLARKASRGAYPA